MPPNTCFEDCRPSGCWLHVSEVLGLRRGARPSDALFRWPFKAKGERPPATLYQPCGLASAGEFRGKRPNSRTSLERLGYSHLSLGDMLRPSGKRGCEKVR